MNYALILAGGVGSRFWPLSRKGLPKQFLAICSKKPMIEETVGRIANLVKKENIYIASNKAYGRNLTNYARSAGVSLNNILFEPEAKNTMAPIAVYSKLIYDLDKDALIAVLPSDHFVEDKRAFLSAMRRGIDAAKKDVIVTFGVIPTRPETGYGYINAARVSRKALRPYYRVKDFIEKPGSLKAKRLAGGRGFFWNSGIFIFKAEAMLKEIARFAPEAYRLITRLNNKKDCLKKWPYLPSLSIDYAIMQKTDKAVVLPLDCGWGDLGSWVAVTELMKKNKQGNIFKGKCLDIGSKNTFVWSENRITATLGLEGLIIIDTPDALLVCPRERAQEVKNIVGLLRQKKLRAYL